MPKAFNDTEKEYIRGRLLERGAALFGQYGLKKTNVEELARAAGISKGAFYLFFESKEALFFEIMERSEAEVRERVLAEALRPDREPRERIRAMLEKVLDILAEHPLGALLDAETMDVLARRLPGATLQGHLAADERAVRDFLQRLEASGIHTRQDPRLVAGWFKMLLFVGMQRAEFGEEVYQMTVAYWVDCISRDWVGEAGGG